MSLFTAHIKINQLAPTRRVVTKSHLRVPADLSTLINTFHCPWKKMTGKRKTNDHTILWVIISSAGIWERAFQYIGTSPHIRKADPPARTPDSDSFLVLCKTLPYIYR